MVARLRGALGRTRLRGQGWGRVEQPTSHRRRVERRPRVAPRALEGSRGGRESARPRHRRQGRPHRRQSPPRSHPHVNRKRPGHPHPGRLRGSRALGRRQARARRAGRRRCPGPARQRGRPAGRVRRNRPRPNHRGRAGQHRRHPAPDSKRDHDPHPAPNSPQDHLAKPARLDRPRRPGRRRAVVAGVGPWGEVGRRGVGVERSGASGARPACARPGPSWPEESPWTHDHLVARVAGPRGRARRSRVAWGRVGRRRVRQRAVPVPTGPGAGRVRGPSRRGSLCAAREPRHRHEDSPPRSRPRRPHSPCPRSRPVPSPPPRRSGRRGCPGPVWVPCRRWSRTAASTSRPLDRWAFPPAGSCP